MATRTAGVRMTVSDEVASLARGLVESSARSRLVLKNSDGSEMDLPDGVHDLLTAVLRSAADGDTLRMSGVPDEMTSTVAADHLGISRPTLMKLVERGEIACSKAGTHTRFLREDVEELRARRQQERRAAFEDLRALDDEWGFGRE